MLCFFFYHFLFFISGCFCKLQHSRWRAHGAALVFNVTLTVVVKSYYLIPCILFPLAHTTLCGPRTLGLHTTNTEAQRGGKYTLKDFLFIKLLGTKECNLWQSGCTAFSLSGNETLLMSIADQTQNNLFLNSQNKVIMMA